MTDIIDPNFSPYDQLQDVIRFCHAADKHIQTLVENQNKMLEQIETLSNRMFELEMIKLEKDYNEAMASARQRPK